jgi:hypothetical protein
MKLLIEKGTSMLHLPPVYAPGADYAACETWGLLILEQRRKPLRGLAKTALATTPQRLAALSKDEWLSTKSTGI